MADVPFSEVWNDLSSTRPTMVPFQGRPGRRGGARMDLSGRHDAFLNRPWNCAEGQCAVVCTGFNFNCFPCMPLTVSYKVVSIRTTKKRHEGGEAVVKYAPLIPFSCIKHTQSWHSLFNPLAFTPAKSAHLSLSLSSSHRHTRAQGKKNKAKRVKAKVFLLHDWSAVDWRVSASLTKILGD